MSDNPTYACDRCSCPTELTQLVPFKNEHICRICDQWYHNPEQRTAETLRRMAGWDANVIEEEV